MPKTMTARDIDAIPAGRELDVLIAEWVTEWKARHIEDKCNGEYFIRCGACGAYGHGNCYGNGAGAIQIKCGESRACCDNAWMPNYSTDISAAWEIAEKLKLTITPKVDATEKSRWLADTRLAWHEEPWLAYGATAPLAICRAALKAMLSE